MDIPIDVPRERKDTEARVRWIRLVFGFPWWLAALVAIGLYVVNLIVTNELYGNIFNYLLDGLSMTLTVSVVAYTAALAIGLVIGIIRANPPQPVYGRGGPVLGIVRLVLYNAATFYIQIMRGLPILVTLLIVAFVIIPQVSRFLDSTFGIQLGIRGSSPTSAIIALSMTYAAFLSETFRAGIQSIGRGQVEAARSLGMNYGQVMRYIVLPQAVRRVLPPLGNDLIAMIKDSSLVAILGIEDITQMAKLSSSTSFRYLETYLIAASIYLLMTVLGSMVVRTIERRVEIDH